MIRSYILQKNLLSYLIYQQRVTIFFAFLSQTILFEKLITPLGQKYVMKKLGFFRFRF
jgi:hypothetical protein